MSGSGGESRLNISAKLPHRPLTKISNFLSSTREIKIFWPNFKKITITPEISRNRPRNHKVLFRNLLGRPKASFSRLFVQDYQRAACNNIRTLCKLLYTPRCARTKKEKGKEGFVGWTNLNCFQWFSSKEYQIRPFLYTNHWLCCNIICYELQN